jgi:N-acetylneuraminic acid mutarotase
MSTLQGGVHRYDPLMDEWLSLLQPSSFEYNFHYSGGFLIGNEMFVGLGYDMPEQRKFWSYNIETGIWSPVKSYPGNAYHSPISFEVNGKGYMGGGYQYSDLKHDFWEFNLTNNNWTRQADLPTVVIPVGAFSFSGNGYVVSNSNGRLEIWRYEP